MNSYPSFFIPLALLVGVILAFSKPFRGFIFAVFGLAALHFKAATLTRTFFGPYLNLADTFMIIMVVALGLEVLRLNKKLPVPPRVLFLLLAVWLIGSMMGLMTLGPTYELFREIRWALNFILCILIAYTFVSTPKRVKAVVIALFAAAVMAAVQHLVFVREGINVTGALRTIGFMFTPMSYFVVVALTLPLQVMKTWPLKVRIIWWVGIALFSISILLNQTRSQWIAIIAGAAVVAFVIGKPFRVIRIYLLVAVLLVAIGLAIPFIVPGIDPFALIVKRAAFLTDENARYSASIERLNQFFVELKLWFDGGFLSWWMGKGFAFNFQEEIVRIYGSGPAEGARVAWGHIGYVTYLARLGIIGLIVYAVVVPIAALQAALRLYRQAEDYFVLLLSLLAISVAVMDMIQFMMSSSYLQPELSVSALIIGASLGYAHRALPVKTNAKVALDVPAAQRPENAALRM